MNEEIGYVTASRGYLTILDGLPSVKINDLVISGNLRGLVNSFSEDSVEVLMLDEGAIAPGQSFKKLPGNLGINVGPYLIGRQVNPLGVPIDGKGPLSKSKDTSVELDQEAKGIAGRKFISEQFVTGINLVDTLVPIGRGQRELVIGDAHSGKTAFLIDTIVNQRQNGVICVVGLIGKTAQSTKSFVEILRANKALSYTVVVASLATDLAPLIYLTPKTAMTVAEHFQKMGKDVLLILDDMGIHAKIYREISLLGNKSPGRSSYPGDIFYQQAHILERAGNFKAGYGGGSITALPVIELNLSDFTTLIPTNLMAMTDGHLLFSASLYAQNQRPAIDLSISVSRVGRQTQTALANSLSLKVRQILAEAQKLETISKFSSELPIPTQQLLRQKELIREMFKQEALTGIPLNLQICLLGLIFTSFLSNSEATFLEKNKGVIINAFLTNPSLIQITKSIPILKNEDQLIKLLEGAGGILEGICK